MIILVARQKNLRQSKPNSSFRRLPAVGDPGPARIVPRVTGPGRPDKNMNIKIMERDPQRLLDMAKDFGLKILPDQPIAMMQTAIVSAYLQQLDKETRRTMRYKKQRRHKNGVGIDSDFDL
jgi:hypothetical protein